MVALAVIVTYASEPLEQLELTLRSLEAARTRTRSELRIHLATDSYRRGVAWNLNGALRAIDAPLVSWVACGDEVLLERYVELPDRPQFCEWIDEEGVHRKPQPEWERRIYRDNQFSLGGMIVPVLVWQDVGGFDESLKYMSDWDFAMRVQHRYGWEYLPKALAISRELPGGLTRSADPDERQACRRRVLRKAKEMRGR